MIFTIYITTAANILSVARKSEKTRDEKTYFYDTNASTAANNYYDEKLYEPTNNTDTTNSDQTLIYETDATSIMPWFDAISVANVIRGLVNLNFNDAKGNSACQNLIAPTNTGSTVSSVISNSAECNYYGVPCQGSELGTTSSCPELGFRAQNILNKTTGNGEVFHPQDLTAAMTSTNSWSSTYRNKFVKVTNLSNSKSIIVRVTDTAPANKGIELTYRSWVSIGKPSGVGAVKIELMS